VIRNILNYSFIVRLQTDDQIASLVYRAEPNTELTRIEELGDRKPPPRLPNLPMYVSQWLKFL